jgi:uncharacterized RDD family membrane protein YckC
VGALQPETSESTGRHTRWYFLLRVIAATLDYVIYFAIFFAYARYFGSPTDNGYQVQGCGHISVLAAAWVVWLPIAEAVFGRTFGKWACDLRVVNLNGGAITMGQAFLRHVLDPVDLFSFFGFVGYIVARTNPLNQRVGDLIAKTRVIAE